MPFLPKFGDFGKKASDLFSDDFGADRNTLTFKSKTANGTSLKVEGSHNNTNGSVSGLIETKFTHKPSGITFKEKWNTKNEASVDATVKNLFMPNSECTLTATFPPNGKGDLTGKIKGSVTRDHFTFNGDCNLSKANLAASIGNLPHLQGFLVGASATVNTSPSISDVKVGLCHSSSDYEVAAKFNLNHVDASIFHQPCSPFKLGVQFGWDMNKSDSTFGVAGQYKLDQFSFTKFSLDKDLKLRLSYVQDIRKGVTLRLSADTDGLKPSAANKVGFQLTFGE